MCDVKGLAAEQSVVFLNEREKEVVGFICLFFHKHFFLRWNIHEHDEGCTSDSIHFTDT